MQARFAVAGDTYTIGGVQVTCTAPARPAATVCGIERVELALLVTEPGHASEGVRFVEAMIATTPMPGYRGRLYELLPLL